MAQTKRRRQTKHRGNAAGEVESRGRTGRKPTAAEKSGKAGDAARAKAKLVDKRDRPPTWTSAFYRAMLASILFLLVSLFLIGGKAAEFFPIVLAGYWPISFYTDRWMFNRRQRNKAKRGGGS